MKTRLEEIDHLLAENVEAITNNYGKDIGWMLDELLPTRERLIAERQLLMMKG